ncbi:MAG: GNAT family N-acetyltransferase [Hyphomicrobiales bacterium]|nr:GNAT family N-acetyltransferase [Hyphomicrobiales bacterium]
MSGHAERNTECDRSAPGAVLRTARLYLRPPEIADAGTITGCLAERRIAEMAGTIPHPYRLTDAEAFIAKVRNDGPDAVTLLAFAAGGAEFLVGCCGFRTEDNGETHIGYWVALPHWGCGFATEMARAVVDHTFAATTKAQLWATCRIVNPASRRVLEKCGFQHRGEAMRHSLGAGGMVPVARFVLERSIWTGLKAWRDD